MSKLTSFNNLAFKFPEIAKQWHPTKNGNLKPDQVTYGSGKIVWWKCKIGNDHEWPATINSQTSGRGCPFCSGNRFITGHSLADNIPKLAALWHPTKNGSLKPDQVSPRSGKIVWWKCQNRHVWKTSIIKMAKKKTYCSFCSGEQPSKEFNLAVIRPDLAAEWHPTKNGNLKPDQVTPDSSKKVWWKCQKGHAWPALISSRSNGRGCRVCSIKRVSKGNSLAFMIPKLAAEWHPTKNGNLKPDQVTYGSHKIVWWKCLNGHAWPARIYMRSQGTGCPHCWMAVRIEKTPIDRYRLLI